MVGGIEFQSTREHVARLVKSAKGRGEDPRVVEPSVVQVSPGQHARDLQRRHLVTSLQQP